MLWICRVCNEENKCIHMEKAVRLKFLKLKSTPSTAVQDTGNEVSQSTPVITHEGGHVAFNANFSLTKFYQFSDQF